MRSSEPPALATWMLEHLTLGDRKESLAGDLLEEFQRRRSVVWYWRQVLGAILVSLSNELRVQWVAVSAQFAFAVVWTYAFTAFVLPWIRARYLLTSDMDNPYAYIMSYSPYAYVIWTVSWILLVVALPLSICLGVTGKLNFLAFTRSLSVGMLCVGVLVVFALTGIWPPRDDRLTNFLVAHGLATGWAERVVDSYRVLTGSVPLLLAMWAAQLSKKRSRGTTIPG